MFKKINAYKHLKLLLNTKYIMVFGQKKENWKDNLSEDAQNILAGLFESTKKHRGAYLATDNVNIAQLWSALIEIKKEINELAEAVGRIEMPFKAIVAVGEAAKKSAIESFVREIVKPETEDQEEATKKLVDSLMKF